MGATVDLELLSMFVEVASSASFSKAAQALGTTTATVSRGISKLEQLVGSDLLHRTTRSVSLSTAGTALFERAAPHVRALRSAARELPERQEEPAGVLKLTAPYDLGVVLLGEVVARFTLVYPKISVQAELTNRRVDVIAEGFDLAIRGSGGKERNSSLKVKRLVRQAHFHCYAAPTYVARRGAPRAVGSAEHDWLVAEPLRRLMPLPKELQSRISGSDFLFLREAARAGAGLALLPAFMADPLLETGELVRVLPQLDVAVGGLVMLYPTPAPRKVTAFRDFLIEAIKRAGYE